MSDQGILFVFLITSDKLEAVLLYNGPIVALYLYLFWTRDICYVSSTVITYIFAIRSFFYSSFAYYRLIP